MGVGKRQPEPEHRLAELGAPGGRHGRQEVRQGEDENGSIFPIFLIFLFLKNCKILLGRNINVPPASPPAEPPGLLSVFPRLPHFLEGRSLIAGPGQGERDGVGGVGEVEEEGNAGGNYYR